MTSARSAGAISSRDSFAGRGRKPPSLPICQNGRPSTIELQNQRARIAGVQEPEAVAALLDVEERPGVAVDHHRVAEELRIPDRRDIARAAVARAARDERNLQVLAARRLRRTRDRPGRTASHRRLNERSWIMIGISKWLVVRRTSPTDGAGPGSRATRCVVGAIAAQQIERRQTGVQVRARDAERVIVHPQRRLPPDRSSSRTSRCPAPTATADAPRPSSGRTGARFLRWRSRAGCCWRPAERTLQDSRRCRQTCGRREGGRRAAPARCAARDSCPCASRGPGGFAQCSV